MLTERQRVALLSFSVALVLSCDDGFRGATIANNDAARDSEVDAKVRGDGALRDGFVDSGRPLDRGPVRDADIDARVTDVGLADMQVDSMYDAILPMDLGTDGLPLVDSGFFSSCAEGCAAVSACVLSDPTICARFCESYPTALLECPVGLGVSCSAGELPRCIEGPEHSCLAGCGSLVRCGLIDAELCLANCASDDADPLVRNLLERTRAWLIREGADGDCRALRSSTRLAEVSGPVDLFEYCRRGWECQDIECGAVVSLGVRQQRAGRIVECLMAPELPCVEHEAAVECRGADWNEPSSTDRACGLLCEAKGQCGLPGGPPAVAECVEGCRRSLENGEYWGSIRSAVALDCRLSETCDTLAACVESRSIEAQCDLFCSHLELCDLGRQDCIPECLSAFPTSRHTSYRACVAQVVGSNGLGREYCGEMETCGLPPPPPCIEWCSHLVSSCPGKDFGPGTFCEEMCDDTWSQDPEGFWAEVACVLGEADCGHDAPASEPSDIAFPQCRPEPGVRGRACLHWCRHQAGCIVADGGASLYACLTDCGTGLGGQEGQAFSDGRECLEGLPSSADCGAIQACLE